MSTETPDEAGAVDSVPIDELRGFFDVDDGWRSSRGANGSISGAFRPAQRFYEAMHTTGE
ncbi:MAG: hypothetical protein ABEH47_05735 [Haloferacaceae archaeon]